MAEPVSLPAYEYPFADAFEEITGSTFWSREDFMAALRQAGYLRLLNAPILEWQIGGLALLGTGIGPAAVGGFLGFVATTASAFGVPIVEPLAWGEAPSSPRPSRR